MTTHFLPIYHKNASLELREMLPAIVSGYADGGLVLRFCKAYRARGICSLFLTGNTTAFTSDLHKSGRAFSHYLHAADDRLKVTSKAAPLFDALASDDWDCVPKIAKQCRLTWNAEEEYEEDFLYFLFLLQHFLLQDTRNESRTTLLRYEQVLDGQHDYRFEICNAFSDGNNTQFETALCELLEAHERYYQDLANADAVLPEELATEGNLCVEGVALVKLALRKDFHFEEDYQFIPSSTYLRKNVSFSSDDWMDL